MNKMRRCSEPQISFPTVDKKTAHQKGTLPGNMMGYPDKEGPKTSHVAGKMPGNMMAYKASRDPVPFPSISNETQNYGHNPLQEPTSVTKGKSKPQPVGWSTVNPENPEWTRIQSAPNKKRSR